MVDGVEGSTTARSAVPRVVIVVLAYEAEHRIAAVLDRIPPRVGGVVPLVLVADDASTDATAEEARRWAVRHPTARTEVVQRRENLGYGGNQIASYELAAGLGGEVVVLLHGDGQYPPERIGDLVTPILAGAADAVYGSRMRTPGGALAGGMPWRRFVGNRALTRTLNAMGRTDLSEWFTGFRAYRVDALSQLDLRRLPSGFDFDISITFELLEAGFRIEEISIPTRYTDEISRVPLLATGVAALTRGVRSPRWRGRSGRRSGAARRVEGRPPVR